jgi:ABC-2 type transport system permease protein
MKEFLLPLLSLIRKEALITLKDKRNRITLFVPIILQMILFGYVATYDVTNVPWYALDEDHSEASRDLIAQIDGAPAFERAGTLENSAQIAGVIESKKALMVVHIGPGFQRALELGHEGPVQVITDGRNSNTAGTAGSYVTSIISAWNAKRLAERGVTAAAAPSTDSRAWFNPNLIARWGILTAMLAALSAVQVMILSAQSAAREKEQGTFDQLLVTPISHISIMIGKAIPPMCIGLLQSSTAFLIVRYYFEIPFAGSFAVMLATLTLFNLSVVGIGLCISARADTLQQALLFTFALMMPMVLLSGFATPISSMPEVLQDVTLVNPIRWGIAAIQRIYLEGAGFSQLGTELGAMALIAAVTLSFSAKYFRAKL